MNFKALAPQSSYFDSRELHENLVNLDLGRTPLTNLEQLWQASSPLRNLIPELSSYDIATLEGRLEFPRTMAALCAIGTMLRSAEALVVLGRPVGAAQEQMRASQALIDEFHNFADNPDGRAGITFDQFQRFARLFEPLNSNGDLLTLVCLEVVYGDMAKLPSIREALATHLGTDTSDHDIALSNAFSHPRFDTIAQLFPTLGRISAKVYTSLNSNLTRGLNIGHILQMEAPAAVINSRTEAPIHNQDAVTSWFLASLSDLFGARADANDPTSWHKSLLVQGTLAEDLLEVAQNLRILYNQNSGVAFFDSLHAGLYARPYYQPIRDAQALPDEEKRAVYGLSRFLSFELDVRPLDALIQQWNALADTKKNLLTNFLNNSGTNPQTPRPIFTYLPYLFTRLYAQHLPLDEALGRFLHDTTDLLGQLQSNGSDAQWARGTGSAGYYTVSCQDTWRYSLRHLGHNDLRERNLRLAITSTDKGKPEVILQDELLLRSELTRVRLLNALQEATKQAETECKAILAPQLTNAERELLEWVNYLPFVDGSWYRPIHNLIVPMAMLSICRESAAPRLMVIAAIVHDVGYTAFEVPGTLQGAGWTTKSLREGHQLASKEMSAPILNRLRNEGKLRMSDETLAHILEIIATHDNPYIGIPLTDPLAKLHRDADRSFVISCVSFWKDYLAYLSDSKRMETFASHKIRLSPDTFLRLREASFVNDPLNPLREHTSYEPMTSSRAHEIFEAQRSLRAEEFAKVLELLSRTDDGSEEALMSYLRERIVAEFMVLERGDSRGISTLANTISGM
jgi:hypothetical protein